MFLETVLDSDLSESIRSLLHIIQMHVNMLFITVNDMLDFRLIEEGKFEPKIEIFSPIEAFKFILNVLAQTSISN